MASADPYPVPDPPSETASSSRGAGTMLLDLRQTSSSAQSQIVFGLLDLLLERDLWEDLVLVADYELTALAYQLDLRHDTRGRFEHHSEQRHDGAWACYIRRLK